MVGNLKSEIDALPGLEVRILLEYVIRCNMYDPKGLDYLRIGKY